MLKRINILLIIALFGLFLLPEGAYACTLHSKETVKKEMSCCITKKSKEEKHHNPQSEQNGDKDCCDTQHEDDNKCSGACGSQSCHSTTFSFTATPPVAKNTYCSVNLQYKKSYPIYIQNSYSLREFSIWQPPKIS